MLGLYAEQEGGGEVLDVLHADLVVLGLEGAEVTVEESDEIPNTGKHQPGGKVGTCNITDRLSDSQCPFLFLDRKIFQFLQPSLPTRFLLPPYITSKPFQFYYQRNRRKSRTRIAWWRKGKDLWGFCKNILQLHPSERVLSDVPYTDSCFSWSSCLRVLIFPTCDNRENWRGKLRREPDWSTLIGRGSSRLLQLSKTGTESPLASATPQTWSRSLIVQWTSLKRST